MPIEVRNWATDPMNTMIVGELASLVAQVKSGKITSSTKYLTRAGTETGNYYMGIEIKNADASFHKMATRLGVFLKKDMAGGQGGSANSRSGWRIIALFKPEGQLVPGYEFFWKHGPDIQRLHPDFLKEAQKALA